MLKALELFGFKSFADKTRFEFPEGITVVVGPNGSGKSNIVDGIKWVLGEQSAKSLRGSEMADVIFKGTGESGRRPMNSAEATLIFDNAQGAFPIEAPEVHLTRRVYRSGEGEYLINGKPCRLKDIRDLCRGTGVGVDAYSLIEQGKVDRLLQASPKDRRAIFEEAAGISRFKAKKVEAQRRLERVEQNLLRLSDIVEEVEGRLRSVRGQAAKAQRYREYSERLQQLRTQVGFADWRRLSEKLAHVEDGLAVAREQAGAQAAETEAGETRLRELELTIERATESLRNKESQLARQREQIMTRESTIENDRTRCRDFEEEAERHRQQLRAMTGRAGDLQGRLQELAAAWDGAEAEARSLRARLASHERAATDLANQIEHLRRDNESRRATYVEQTRTAAQLGNQVTHLESQLSTSHAAAERALQRLKELDQTCLRQAEQLEQTRAAEVQLAEEVNTQAAKLETAEVQLADNRRVLTRRQEELAVLQGKSAGAVQRARVLEELERQHAGLSSGVQEVLDQVRRAPQELAGETHGLVADLIEAPVEVAPLVDVALGEAAQHVVLSGDRLIRSLESGDFRPGGRVGFVRLDVLCTTLPLAFSPLVFGGRGDLQGRPGVIDRADRLVRTHERFQPVVTHLLGDTWFVEQLADALVISRTAAGRGMRFVTSKGELLEADGTLIVGPPQLAVGIVSRRSELRALQREIIDLQRRIAESAREVTRLHENIDRQDNLYRRLVDHYRRLTASLADQRVRSRTLQDRQDQLQQRRATIAAELETAQTACTAAVQELETTRTAAASLEASLATLAASLQTEERRVQELETHWQTHTRHVTGAKIELAKSEQRLDSLRTQRQQLETDHRERARAIADVQGQLEQACQRHAQTELDILRLESELAELYLRKESLALQAAQENARRVAVHAERAALADHQEQLRRKLRKLQDQQHRLELAAGEIQHERHTLADRLREDYGIDLTQVTQAETPEQEQQRTEVETEIADLRNKINRIGAVNLDALEELDDLEQRYQTLSGQFRDLTQAKESLERIIQKMNTDSRRLFLETLEGIRANFQVLYRKAFGGGRADIVLEEGADVLEGGVDILATPPGKPSFTNSLLSGGEKALTAVALLLAIFQFRPSPFCILDEVDAPFDEANIGRFIDVLREFLRSTKFVIVTHSKKTMTAASTLYGVTMQESGVSKRVSVRFEDVSDDGQISAEAVRREDDHRRTDQAA
jgi:chromosome segregation protein